MAHIADDRPNSHRASPVRGSRSRHSEIGLRAGIHSRPSANQFRQNQEIQVRRVAVQSLDGEDIGARSQQAQIGREVYFLSNSRVLRAGRSCGDVNSTGLLPKGPG